MSVSHKPLIVCAALALVAMSPSSGEATPIFYGPLAYVQAGDSPFGASNSSDFYLETFEDGLVNTRGLTASGGIVIGFDPYVDSIDAEDGFVDGVGSPDGHSLWSGFTETQLIFSFDAGLLGGLPTHAGVVWTDIGYNSPTPYYGPVSFEAFGPSGLSLGSIGPFVLGDGIDTGQTAEDRFFGVFDLDGISAIRVSTNTRDWEVDDVQYGKAAVARVPEPSSLLLLGLGAGVCAAGRRGHLFRRR